MPMIGDNMSKNEIILLAIIAIVGGIIVFVIYFGYIYTRNKISKKKVDSIFDPEKLVEEESLMNTMDEKRNVEYKTPTQDNFITEDTTVDLVQSETPNNTQINPFGVDLTKTTIEGKDYIKEEEERAQNKFFK